MVQPDSRCSGASAAGLGAAAVAGCDGAAECVGDGSPGTSDVEGLSGSTEEDGNDARVAGQHPQICG